MNILSICRLKDNKFVDFNTFKNPQYEQLKQFYPEITKEISRMIYKFYMDYNNNACSINEYNGMIWHVAVRMFEDDNLSVYSFREIKC